MTVEKAIEFLEGVRRRSPQKGDTSILFGDGSPVMLEYHQKKELSPDHFKNPVVQVRLDRTGGKC